MRNPFRSEAEAYRFLFLTIAACTVVVLASLLGGAWAGVPVWLVVTAAAAFFYLRQGRAGRLLRTAPAHVGAEDERRILVVADETVTGERLSREIERAALGHRERVLIVCPALVSPLRRWTSDVDHARAQAQCRLDESLTQLRNARIEAEGEVGDADPLRAIEDALRTFGADEIIICTHPEAGSNRLERGVVPAARERFALPITHVVVDQDRS